MLCYVVHLIILIIVHAIHFPFLYLFLFHYLSLLHHTMSIIQNSCRVLALLFALFSTSTFKAKFNLLERSVKSLLELVATADAPTAKEIMASM